MLHTPHLYRGAQHTKKKWVYIVFDIVSKRTLEVPRLKYAVSANITSYSSLLFIFSLSHSFSVCFNCGYRSSNIHLFSLYACIRWGTLNKPRQMPAKHTKHQPTHAFAIIRIILVGVALSRVWVYKCAGKCTLIIKWISVWCSVIVHGQELVICLYTYMFEMLETE